MPRRRRATSDRMVMLFGSKVGKPSARTASVYHQRVIGCPVAICARRSGSRFKMARCRSAVAPLHSPISAMVRPQPVQKSARASSVQTSTHGDSGRSITLFLYPIPRSTHPLLHISPQRLRLNCPYLRATTASFFGLLRRFSGAIQGTSHRNCALFRVRVSPCFNLIKFLEVWAVLRLPVSVSKFPA